MLSAISYEPLEFEGGTSGVLLMTAGTRRGIISICSVIKYELSVILIALKCSTKERRLEWNASVQCPSRTDKYNCKILFLLAGCQAIYICHIRDLMRGRPSTLHPAAKSVTPHSCIQLMSKTPSISTNTHTHPLCPRTLTFVTPPISDHKENSGVTHCPPSPSLKE